MKFKYTGDLDSITLRGVTFEKGKPTEVDDALAEKIGALDYFNAVKPRKVRNGDDA